MAIENLIIIPINYLRIQTMNKIKSNIDFKITKYRVDSTSKFDKNYKLIKKQGKKLNKLKFVINKLAEGK